MKILKVRVKTCGKSARSRSVIFLRGKPYLEQDKAVCSVVCSDLNIRVCRKDKWLPHLEKDDRIRLIDYLIFLIQNLSTKSINDRFEYYAKNPLVPSDFEPWSKL